MDNRIISLAIDLASKSPFRSRHGAVIFEGCRNIISIGKNSPFPTKFAGLNGFRTTHAEIDALADLLKRPDLYPTHIRRKMLVIRIGKDERLLNSSPCQKCRSIMKKYINSVFYSNDQGKIVWENLE